MTDRDRPYAPPDAPGEMAARIDESYDDQRAVATLLRQMAAGLRAAAAGQRYGLDLAANAAIGLAENAEAEIVRGEVVAAKMREAFGEPEEEVPE